VKANDSRYRIAFFTTVIGCAREDHRAQQFGASVSEGVRLSIDAYMAWGGDVAVFRDRARLPA